MFKESKYPYFYKYRNKKLAEQKKEEERIKNRKSRIYFLSAWRSIFPAKIICQVCGKRIYLNHKNKKLILHFDHQHGETFKKINPRQWLRSHRPIKKNIKIWESFDFGLLCNSCNRFLPTINRKQYLQKVINYVFKNRYIAKSKHKEKAKILS